jgi:hypothetical protein
LAFPNLFPNANITSHSNFAALTTLRVVGLPIEDKALLRLALVVEG